MENFYEVHWLNDGFQAEFSTKESEGELPLHAVTGIDGTENILFFDHTTSEDGEIIKLVKELEAIYQAFEKTKKETSKAENRFEICSKTFSTKGNLTAHLRIHTGERPHKCDECEKEFKTKTNLIRVFLTHTHERPLCCGTCGKSFSVSFNLRRHLLTHTKEKPYICIKCNKTYASGDKLKQHIRTHEV